MIKQDEKCSDCGEGVMKYVNDYHVAPEGGPTPPELRLRCNNPKCGVVKFLDGTRVESGERI